MVRPRANAQVYIYESEFNAIFAAARDFLELETGGDLFGTFTHGDVPIIWLASGPGPKARRNRTEFEQDSEFTTVWERRLKERFALQYIGSWHSHHQLGLREPSSGDRESARKYALNHGRLRTLEIIATHEGHRTYLWPYFYPNAQEGVCVGANFIQLPGSSPVRLQLGSDEAAFTGSVGRKEPQLPYEVRGQNTGGSPGSTASDDMVEIPIEIQGEIESVADAIKDVDQTGRMFKVKLSARSGQDVDTYIDLSSLTLVRIVLLDRSGGNPREISSIVRNLGLPVSLRRQGSGVLKRLLLELPRIQQELERSTRISTSQSSQSLSAETPKASDSDAGPKLKAERVGDARSAHIQVRDANQESHDEGVWLIITVWGEQALKNLQGVIEHVQIVEDKQHDNVFVAKTFVQDSQTLRSLLEKLKSVFPDLSFDPDNQQVAQRSGPSGWASIFKLLFG